MTDKLSGFDRENIQSEIGALRHLLQSPGWLVLKSELDRMTEYHLGSATGAKDPHTQTRELGAYTVAKAASNWPMKQITFLEGILKVDSGQ